MNDNLSKKILIIEDEEALLNLLAEKFEEKSFTVEKAKNGVEGLTKALNSHPDVILLDLVMPGMDGITMLQKLRDDEWGKDAYVHVLTNKDDTSSISETMDLKISQYMVKSDWKINDLVNQIATNLEILQKNTPKNN